MIDLNGQVFKSAIDDLDFELVQIFRMVNNNLKIIDIANHCSILIIDDNFCQLTVNQSKDLTEETL